MLKELFKKKFDSNVKKKEKEAAQRLYKINKMTTGWVHEILSNAEKLGTYEVRQGLRSEYCIEEDGICITVRSSTYLHVKISIKETGLEDLTVCYMGYSDPEDVCKWIHQGSWVDLTIKILEDIEEKNNMALEHERTRKEKELQERLDRYNKRYRLTSLFK